MRFTSRAKSERLFGAVEFTFRKRAASVAIVTVRSIWGLAKDVSIAPPAQFSFSSRLFDAGQS